MQERLIIKIDKHLLDILVLGLLGYIYRQIDLGSHGQHNRCILGYLVYILTTGNLKKSSQNAKFS